MNKKLEKELGRVNEELARSEKHIKEAQEHHKTLLEKKTQIENDIIIDRIMSITMTQRKRSSNLPLNTTKDFMAGIKSLFWADLPKRKRKQPFSMTLHRQSTKPVKERCKEGIWKQ